MTAWVLLAMATVCLVTAFHRKVFPTNWALFLFFLAAGLTGAAEASHRIDSARGCTCK